MSKTYKIFDIAKLNQSTIKSDDEYLYINYLDTSSITKNKVESFQYLADNYPSRAKRKIKENTIIYSTVRPNQEHHGIFENFNGIENIIVSTGFTTIDVISNEINPKYLYYKLTQAEITNFLQTIGESAVSAYPSINPSDIGNLKFKFPDLDTQEKITSILSSLDNKIELNNKINAELEAMAKLIYDYWFVQFDFPNSKGKPYKSSGGKMIWNEELKREIPEGWEYGTLGDLGEIIGGSTPSKNDDENFCLNGISWITPKDLSLNIGKKFIGKGEIDVSEKGIKTASLKVLPKGTVLLSSRAPIGYLAIAKQDLTTNQGFKSFVPNKGYTSEYIYYVLKTSLKIIELNASGSTFKEISGTVLKSIPAFLPSKNILENFNNKVGAIFTKQNLLELENQYLTEIRDWLLPMLMNGQVKVGEEPLTKEGALRKAPLKEAPGRAPVKKERAKDSSNYDLNIAMTIFLMGNKLAVNYGEVAIQKTVFNINAYEPSVKEYQKPYGFINSNHGTYSHELKDDLKNNPYLIKKNVQGGKEVFDIDPKKKKEVEAAIKLEENKPFVKAIDKVLTIYRHPFINKETDKIELLNTVTKLIIDIKSTDIKRLYKGMQDWTIKQKGFKTKAEKFNKADTEKMLRVIEEKGLFSLLLNKGN